MSRLLRQSTASQEISLGYFLDISDGNTEETGLTIANTDIKLRKGGATVLASKSSGGATHISNGIYTATLDATDTNTLGMLEVYVHVTGALAVKDTYMVLPAATYDAQVTDGLFNFDPAIDTVATVATLSSAPSNFNLMSIDANGVTNSFVQGYLTTLLTETTTGRIAGNFDTFFENGDSATTKIVEEVGTGGGDWSTTQKEQITFRLGLDGTADIPGATPNLSTQVSVDVIDGNVDLILVDTGTTIPAQITALNDLSAAQVNAEVLDVFTVDTFAELSGVNAATDTMLNKLTFINQVLRNKLTETSTTQTTFADNTTTVVSTAIVSDDGTTFTKNEFS